MTLASESVSIAAVYSGGKLDFDREELRRLCQALPAGPVTITVAKETHQRSAQQNRFWHGVVIPLFSEHCGNELAEMKDVLALELIPVERVLLDGTRVTVPGHTADLTTAQFKDLIERAQRLGASMDIYIPDPDEVVA